MNLLTQIDLTVQAVAPIAKKRKDLARREQLPKVNPSLQALVVKLMETRLKARLVHVYGLPVPPEYTESVKAVKEVVDVGNIVDDAEQGGWFVDLMQQLHKADRLLTASATSLQGMLTSHRQQMRDEVKGAQVRLKLPDLFPNEETRMRFERIGAEVQRLIARDTEEFKQEDQRFAEEWERHYGEFRRLREECSFERLGRRYNLSDQAVHLIETLLSGRPVSLAEATPEALGELARLEHLRGQIILQLRAG